MATKDLPEDAVEYRIFPYIPEDCTREEIDRYLGEQIEMYLAHLSSSVVGYIWQNESFNLAPISAETSDAPPHIYGLTKFGDNIEDEWFIVYLINNLTEEFPGLVAQVNDNDGEFLLIEAANSLPKWVNPETAENRVYFYEGVLHVIPYPLTPAHITLLPTDTPTTTQAVSCIRENPSLTMAQAAVQQDIQSRLSGYPDKADATRHHTHCYIPACLAAVLDHSPAMVAPMVQAFYYRDPADLKACITFRHFPPGTRVMRRVEMTRCLYAQLTQQRFTPDRRSGYSMPATSNPKYTAYDLGAKLAHGAEILCSRCGSADPVADPLKAVTSDPRWSRYLATLGAKGYFKGELEGSRLYNKLLEDAKKYFINSLGATNSPHTEASPGEQIYRLSKQVHYDIEEMRKQEKSLPLPDDAGWLEIAPSELDSLLEKASGKRVHHTETEEISEMVKGVKSFVSTVSSHEGAEVPAFDDTEIQFDPNSFMQSMQKVFDFEDSDGGSSSGLDEYGSEDDAPCLDYTPRNQSGPADGRAHTNGDLGIQDYMELMDRELANTRLADSFQRYPADTKDNSPEGPVAPPRKKKQAKKASSQSAASSSSSSSQSTPQHRPSRGRAPRPAPRAGGEDDVYDVDDLDEDFRPVNVDLNLVTNLLESYGAQAGTAGPASNLLGSMGLRGPQDRTARVDDL